MTTTPDHARRAAAAMAAVQNWHEQWDTVPAAPPTATQPRYALTHAGWTVTNLLRAVRRSSRAPRDRDR